MIGQLLAGHNRVLQVFGVGGFGQTYITEDLHLPGNPKCVLKHLKPASADRSLLEVARKFFEKEAIVLHQLGNHDRIIDIHLVPKLATHQSLAALHLSFRAIELHFLSCQIT